MDFTRSFGDRYLDKLRKLNDLDSLTDQQRSEFYEISSQFQEYMLEGIASISNVISLEEVEKDDKETLSMLINELTMFSMDALATNNRLNKAHTA